MIFGIGCDIVEIERIEKALERTPKLARRLLTDGEYRSFSSSKSPARFLAKRFAAKEAIVKALGTGIACGVGWHQVEIIYHERGRPGVRLEGQAERLARSYNITHWHLSYSDERRYVVAQAIAEQRA